MDQYTIKDFGKIIKKNAQSQRHELLPNDTNVFRIYDRNQEDFPVTIDIYSNYARVQVYADYDLDPSVVEIITDQINRMVYIDRDKIVFSYRAKREKGQQHEKTNKDALIVNVKENGLSFRTDLTTYADTGLFLDHINTRSMIRESCAGLNVLNLFSYTGSFSVYAAAGRAASVTSVDLSATYTKWAEENLKTNGFEGDSYSCICCDAKKYVDDAIKKEQRYDIIIFDPPAFSNSHKMEEDFDVQKDFYDWIRNLRTILTKNGMIMFSTNLGSFKMDKRRLRGFNVKEMTSQLWADGFVKGRKGTTRSWVMALDDNSLTLDWSEPSKKEGEKKERRSYEKRDGERRNYRDNKHFGDRRDSRGYRDHKDSRDNRDYHDRDRQGRDHRDFHEHRERRDDFGHNDRRDRYEHRDREDYSRDRKSFDRPRSDHRDYRRDGERRRFDRNNDRNFEHRDRKPRYEHSDYEAKHKYTERREDRPSREPKKKPYGYDSFRPARSRDDSADFFWNED